jgi:hypothetical protein
MRCRVAWTLRSKWLPARGLWLAAGPAALALILLSVGPARADLGGYSIDRFDTQLQVEDNADLLVEERIEVLFSEPRHGIYRDIPVRYTDPRGFAYAIDLRLLGVEDEAGRSLGSKVDSQGQYVHIRIGDPDRLVDGRQVYVVRYRVRGAVTRMSDHDELYWNAVGDEWQTDIRSATVNLRLPGGIAADEITTGAWTGHFGSQDEDVSIDAASPEAIGFETSRVLGPAEGLTIRVAWPKGYVSFPSALELWIRRFFDNWILLTPLLALAWLTRRYRRDGRDPLGPAAITVQYAPPEGVGPGEIGTLIDEKVDLPDITATLVDLAVRGFLKIGVETQKKLLWSQETTVFERRAEADASNLLAHEQRVLDGIFEEGGRVTSEDLRERFYKHIPEIQSDLYQHLTDAGYFSANPHTVRLKFGLGGIPLGGLIFGLGLAWALWRGILMPYAMVAPAVAGLLTAGSFALFAGTMPSRTEKGVAMRAWALGFQDFVDRVESDRLERAEARNAFESLLPYAMALGVAATWAKKFEGIYEEAGPSWYIGPHYGGSFSTRGLESSLTGAMAATAKTMAQSPRSSSSGGGGFSGGGFGGGGGGSW